MTEKIINQKRRYELTREECEKLFILAEEAMNNTYPVKNQGYAVALLTKAGNYYTGVSYSSDTETLTMHSEATALAHGAIHGETEIVAITGPNCHICKQLIYESSLKSGIDVVVIVKDGDNFLQIPISTLMPYPWPSN
jgi:cytidine deaminase